jgi:hypothetical protein
VNVANQIGFLAHSGVDPTPLDFDFRRICEHKTKVGYQFRCGWAKKKMADPSLTEYVQVKCQDSRLADSIAGCALIASGFLAADRVEIQNGSSFRLHFVG